MEGLPLSNPQAPALSATNSQGKSPEYDKIWEDGQLTVTYVGGNSGSREPGQADELIERLKVAYGAPTSYQKNPHGDYADVVGEFTTPQGKLRVQTLEILNGNVQQVDASFRATYARFAEVSDLITYNGHSGLGANIEAFTGFAKLTPKHYYLYWINACKPFAHLNDALFKEAMRANPGAPASKYLDVMSVVNIGDFSSGVDVYALIEGLLAKRTFHGLLYWLTTGGGPAVLGDEDNAWPNPFVEARAL